MPIFGNKFSPKKSRTRKSTTSINSTTSQPSELFGENRIVRLNLGEQENVFENGNWFGLNGGPSTDYKTNQKLNKKVLEIQEENNLLKLKVEILLDLLTQATAEGHLQQREIEKLRRNEP